MDNVANLYCELKDGLNPKSLENILELFPIPWVQRCGYLLSLVGGENQTKSIKKLIQKKGSPVTALLPGVPIRGAKIDEHFRVAVNTEVDIDL